MALRLEIVVPVFNEEDCIRSFVDHIRTIAELLPEFEVTLLFVDDGSTDSTSTVIAASAYPHKRLIKLSRNFGKEIAITAGLDFADADVVVLMDVDLQDPPELLPEMVRWWKQGYRVVYGVRRSRRGDGIVRQIAGNLFYRMMARLGDVPIPEDVGDFRLLDKSVVLAFRQLRERNRYSKGLFAWLGFKSKAVSFDRGPRRAGISKWGLLKLWNLGLEGVISFSSLPLTMAMYAGLLISGWAFVYGAWIVTKTLYWGETVQGYPSIMVTMLFLGGAQLFTIGMIGQYLARIHSEVKQRPLYILASELHDQKPVNQDDAG